ncbi:hypothetical protein GJU43_12655 [Flavobacterium sp. LC2016-23]|uniref:hypothetical protein n=1 Tax=Flavobacterium sp. LC2016-23 TaxID=2666330 RepID=UPI0012B10580|nr:hypothetical protein [Flavobacterium sp. LC2016-23]MRX40130.1 hypothetical protein [Flavobacterium sp. LC2016-23]
MTFPDLIKNLLDSSKERLKTPIVGSFMIAFFFYNWRVLAVLFFSTATIEDRIIVINHEYLVFFSYLWPFVISLFYSIGVPYLMKWIDDRLVSVKNARRKQIYDTKDNTLELKIQLADKELALQDKLSRSKDKQEMLDQIRSLEDLNNELKSNNDLQLKDLTEKLKQSNNIITDLKTKIEEIENMYKMEKNDKKQNYKLFGEIYKTLSELHKANLNKFINRKSFESVEMLKLTTKFINKLVDDRIVRPVGKEIVITDLGLDFSNYGKSLNAELNKIDLK